MPQRPPEISRSPQRRARTAPAKPRVGIFRLADVVASGFGVRGRTVAVGGAVATAVVLAVGVAVAVAVPVAVGVAVEPLGVGGSTVGGFAVCGVHAAIIAGVSIAALMTERTTSLMGDRPWYISEDYTDWAIGKWRFGDPSSHSTKGSTA